MNPRPTVTAPSCYNTTLAEFTLALITNAEQHQTPLECFQLYIDSTLDMFASIYQVPADQVRTDYLVSLETIHEMVTLLA